MRALGAANLVHFVLLQVLFLPWHLSSHPHAPSVIGGLVQHHHHEVADHDHGEESGRSADRGGDAPSLASHGDCRGSVHAHGDGDHLFVTASGGRPAGPGDAGSMMPPPGDDAVSGLLPRFAQDGGEALDEEALTPPAFAWIGAISQRGPPAV